MSSGDPLHTLPDPPKELSGVAVEKWYNLGSVIVENGNLTPKNLGAFSNLCFWEGQLSDVKNRLQGRSSTDDQSTEHSAAVRSDISILLTNVKAIQDEINKQRAYLGLEQQKAEGITNLPLIPEEAYTHLPQPIHECCKYIESNRARDCFLVMSLPVMASHICNVLVEHAEGNLSPDLFTFVINDREQPNRFVKKALELGSVLDRHFFKKVGTTYQSLTISLQSGEKTFQEAFYQNRGKGLIYESNLEDLFSAGIFESGFYSYLIKKVSQHEPVIVTVNQQKEMIEFPSLSAGFYGTFTQAGRLNDLVGKENFAGHSIYILQSEKGWQSHRPTGSAKKFNKAVEDASETLYMVFNILNKRDKPLTVELQDEQWQMIDETFAEKMEIIDELGLPGVLQITNQRSAVNALKLAALFSVLSHFSEDPDVLKSEDSITPSESDMIGALWLSDTFIKHAIRQYQYDPEPTTKHTEGERLDHFYAILPGTFTYSKALEFAERLGIPERTARRYLSSFTDKSKLKRLKKGVYQKL